MADEAKVKIRGKDGYERTLRPSWIHKDQTTNNGILEMLESIRNVCEGILKVLQDSEIVYMRGKKQDG